MKFAMYLVLMGALALGPAACTRNNAPDESVSANADRTDRSNQTAPPKPRKTPRMNEQRSVRERQCRKLALLPRLRKRKSVVTNLKRPR
jgi:hypothetical protein